MCGCSSECRCEGVVDGGLSTQQVKLRIILCLLVLCVHKYIHSCCLLPCVVHVCIYFVLFTSLIVVWCRLTMELPT